MFIASIDPYGEIYYSIHMRNFHTLIIAGLVLVLSGCASSGKVEPFKERQAIARETAIKDLSSAVPFFACKKFTYHVAWNGIPVGSVFAETGRPTRYKEYDVYDVRIKTESNKFLSKIYRVEDTYISYVDTALFTSRRYEADRKEGNYRKHVIVEYDFNENKAQYTNLVDGSVKYCEINKDVQDPVSAMCYFMTMPLKLNERVNVTVNLNEKNYEISGNIERVDIVDLGGLGAFPAFRVRPYATLNGESYKKGTGYMYFALGAKRYPLYGVVNIPFGRVTATLVSIEDVK